MLGLRSGPANVGPDLDLKLFDTLMLFMNVFFNKISKQQKDMQNYPVCKELKALVVIVV